MKKEILEILERVYTASQKAHQEHQEHKDEVKQVLDDCKYEDKSLIVTIRLDGYASPLVRDLDRLDRVLDNYK